MKKLFALFCFLALCLTVLPFAQAAEFVAPGIGGASKNDPNVVVGASESHKNLYAAGGNVTVNAKTLGDLIAAGGMVNVEGEVEQDLILAGGNLHINGSIGGDARIAGGNITISGPIAGDLILGGGNVTLSERASVGGDLIVGAGNLIVNGPVKGLVKIAGGNVLLNSKIDGQVNVRATDKLTFGPKAEIASKVFYKAPNEATFQDGSSVPSSEFTPYKQTKERKAATILTVAFLIKLLAWVFAGYLLIRYKKQTVMDVLQGVKAKPWENLGIGLAVLVLVPITVILLLLVFVGYYVSVALLLTYVLALVVANLVSAVIFGYLLLGYLTKSGETPVDWQAVVIGVVVFSVVRLIPVLGWAVAVVIFLMVFGSMFRLFKKSFGNHDQQQLPLA